MGKRFFFFLVINYVQILFIASKIYDKHFFLGGGVGTQFKHYASSSNAFNPYDQLQGVRACSLPHFTGEETGAERSGNLCKVTQLVRVNPLGL